MSITLVTDPNIAMGPRIADNKNGWEIPTKQKKVTE